jgi:hypothetical protein
VPGRPLKGWALAWQEEILMQPQSDPRSSEEAQLRRLKDACARFEAEWQQGLAPTCRVT